MVPDVEPVLPSFRLLIVLQDTFSTEKKVKDMDSHLMAYPIQVAQDGTISTNPTQFPDTTASILGKESFLMPNKLTM